MTEDQPKVTPPKVSPYKDDDKNTSLHYAAAHGDMQKLTKEIEAGHEVDPVNYLGWTPLMMAVRNGHLKVVELLLEKRADSTRKNSFGFNILLMAIGSGDVTMLHVLLQHLLCGGVSRQNMQSFFSPISFAVLLKNAQMLQYLIKAKFCVNAPAAMSGITPLMFANVMGNDEIIDLLICNGAKIKKKAVPKEAASHVVQEKPALQPVILVSHPQFSPQPTFMNYPPPPNVPMPRKCSDLGSPYFTPNLSPLPGVFVEQVFFPQNFSPSQFVGPINPVPVFANDFLNMRVMQPGPYYSPVPVPVTYNYSY